MPVRRALCQQPVFLRFKPVPHHIDKLTHLEAQRLLDILIRSPGRHKIITQNGIPLSDPMSPILRLAVYRRGPVQLPEYHTGCPLQIQPCCCPQGNHAQIGLPFHETPYGFVLLPCRLPTGYKCRMIMLQFLFVPIHHLVMMGKQ